MDFVSNLEALVREVEDHVAAAGWDQPVRLFALVPTVNLLAANPDLASELDKSQTQYLICEAGGRSAQAGMFLEAQGFDVVNIAGGTGALRMMGTPLTTGDQP